MRAIHEKAVNEKFAQKNIYSRKKFGTSYFYVTPNKNY